MSALHCSSVPASLFVSYVTKSTMPCKILLYKLKKNLAVEVLNLYFYMTYSIKRQASVIYFHCVELIMGSRSRYFMFM